MQKHIFILLGPLFLMACSGSSPSSSQVVSEDELFNRLPIFTSSTQVESPENETLIQFRPQAEDENANNKLTFSLSGGVDKDLFSFDGNKLALNFTSAPNFESPVDANADNRYELEFTVFDGFASVQQVIQVLVTDVAEPPTFTSTVAASTPEHVLVTSYTAQALSNFQGSTLSYSISAGADQAKFSINSSTGVLSFVADPDFEVPGDTGGDNIYNIELSASNGVFSTSQNVAITLTDSYSPITSFSVAKGSLPRSLKFDWALLNTDLPDHFVIAASADGTLPFQVLSGATAIANGLRSLELAVPLHLTHFQNTQYRLEERTAANESLVNSATIDLSALNTSADLIEFIKAPNTDVNDEFGYSAVLSGDGTTLAIGAHGEDSNATLINGDESNNDDLVTGNSGAVFVYIKVAGAWQKQAYIKASNTGKGDFFGLPIALSADGNTMAVAAYLEDSDADGVDGSEVDNSAEQSGAVYIYVRSGVAWSKQAYIKASNSDAGDFFGIALDLADDGNTLVVGASNESSDSKLIDGEKNNNASQSGAAYIYTRSAAVWGEQAYIKASNTGGSDNFGRSVSLNSTGNTLVVGAPLEDSSSQASGENNNDAASAGAAYVFTRSASTWTQQAYLKAANAGDGDLFAQSSALSDDGNTLLLGAHGEGAISQSGVVSAQDNSAASAGAAYIFTRTGLVWSQQAYLKAQEAKEGDNFGFSSTLSADGSIAVVGAYSEDSESQGISGVEDNVAAGDSGAAYVFKSNAGSWGQVNYLKASNTGMSDHFGRSVSLSADGQSLVVGAEGEASQAPASSANQLDNSKSKAGAVYIY